MALTRKLLKSMGIEDEKIDQIIDAHTETTEALKKERDQYKADAESLPTVTKERDGLKKDIDELKAKAPDATAVQAEFDAYKQQVEADKAADKKQKLVADALRTAGANDKLLPLILKGIDFTAVELDGDKVKDVDKLVAPIKTQYAEVFGTPETKGTPPTTPPAGGGSGMTREKLEKMSLSERNAYATNNKESYMALMKG